MLTQRHLFVFSCTVRARAPTHAQTLVDKHIMLDILRGVKGLIKWDRCEGPVLWLTSHATSALLAGSSLVLAARQFVGSPIECDHTKEIPSSVLDTWCWIHSTYNVPSSYLKQVGVEVPYPGVDQTRGYKETKVYKFYQWVAFLLFFQVILFFFSLLLPCFSHFLLRGSFKSCQIPDMFPDLNLRLLTYCRNRRTGCTTLLN